MESKTTSNEQKAGLVLMEMWKELNMSQHKTWLTNMNYEKIILSKLFVFFYNVHDVTKYVTNVSIFFLQKTHMKEP